MGDGGTALCMEGETIWLNMNLLLPVILDWKLY